MHPALTITIDQSVCYHLITIVGSSQGTSPVS